MRPSTVSPSAGDTGASCSLSHRSRVAARRVARAAALIGMAAVSRGGSFGAVGVGAAAPATYKGYGDCGALATFALDCLESAPPAMGGGAGAEDDDAAVFEAICAFASSSAACRDRAEYVAFMLPQQVLADCKAGMAPAMYYDLERFKYQCRLDMAGPCGFLVDFSSTCVAPLGDDFDSDGLCGGFSDLTNAEEEATCEHWADDVFEMDQRDVGGCAESLGGDYLSLVRYKHECPSWVPADCQWLRDFAEDGCLGDTALASAATTAALCAEYVWGKGLAPNDFDAQACAARATNIFEVPEAFVSERCSGALPPNDYVALDMLLNQQRAGCPNSGEAPSPAPTVDVSAGGPCGELEAFAAVCLDDFRALEGAEDAAVTQAEREALCGTWKALDPSAFLETANAMEYFCWNTAQTALSLPAAPIDYCRSRMAAGTEEELDTLRTTCAGVEAPPPAPTVSPAPTALESGGPCGFLIAFAAQCLDADEAGFPEAQCARLTAQATWSTLTAEEMAALYYPDGDDTAMECVSTASVAMELGEGNFDYCQTRMPAEAYVALDLARKACAPTEPPSAAPEPGFCCSLGQSGGAETCANCATVFPASSFCGTPGGGHCGNCGGLWCPTATGDEKDGGPGGGSGGSSTDNSGADSAGATAGIAVAVIGAVCLLLGGAYCYAKGGGHKGHAAHFSRDDADFDDRVAFGMHGSGSGLGGGAFDDDDGEGDFDGGGGGGGGVAMQGGRLSKANDFRATSQSMDRPAPYTDAC